MKAGGTVWFRLPLTDEWKRGSYLHAVQSSDHLTYLDYEPVSQEFMHDCAENGYSMVVPDDPVPLHHAKEWHPRSGLDPLVVVVVPPYRLRFEKPEDVDADEDGPLDTVF